MKSNAYLAASQAKGFVLLYRELLRREDSLSNNLKLSCSKYLHKNMAFGQSTVHLRIQRLCRWIPLALLHSFVGPPGSETKGHSGTFIISPKNGQIMISVFLYAMYYQKESHHMHLMNAAFKNCHQVFRIINPETFFSNRFAIFLVTRLISLVRSNMQKNCGPLWNLNWYAYWNVPCIIYWSRRENFLKGVNLQKVISDKLHMSKNVDFCKLRLTGGSFSRKRALIRKNVQIYDLSFQNSVWLDRKKQ